MRRFCPLAPVPLAPALLAAALLVMAPVADACTCFFAANRHGAFFARNYDWHLEQGVVTVNQRGLQKTAFSFDNPARWTSKYGSVTFNQYGREFPNDGMNEAGLVIAVMWLAETRYPERDARPSVGSSQWLQRQLDTAATVKEVLASDQDVRIEPLGGGLVHYLVADATGDCAVIEWIGGKRVAYTGDALVAKALTNDTYANSLAYLRRHRGFGGDAPPRVSYASLDRFVQATLASRQAAMSGDVSISGAAGNSGDAGEADAAGGWSAQQAMASLSGAAQGERTKWSIVYDARSLTIQFRTRSSPAVKRLRLADVEFSTGAPPRVLNLADAPPSGDIAPHMAPYDTQQNLAEINAAFDATAFLRPFPTMIREQIARYPELQCVPCEMGKAAAEPVTAGE
ncbi:MAG: linear amide C-N hydrolase [Planctomycetota bacterium]